MVMRSRCVNQLSASLCLVPHMSRDGRRLLQTAGRRGSPNSLQAFWSVSCMQRTPAGLPFSMPGMGEEMDGAMQQAPQPVRHVKASGGVEFTIVGFGEGLCQIGLIRSVRPWA